MSQQEKIINNPKGNANLAHSPKRKGPRVNTPSQVKFVGGKYKLPGDMIVGLPNKIILRNEFLDFVLNGAKWEQLEQYYQVSTTELKPHFELIYKEAEATLHMQLIASLVKNAIINEDVSIQKWLSKNFLKMSETPGETKQEEQLSEVDIDLRLNEIFKRVKM